VLFLGKLLAEVGMAEGFHVSWLPSYGPEMRGGTANCHINISTRPIGSPVVSSPTVLIALNRPSLEKFEADVAPAGVIIYDSSLIHVAPSRQDVETVAIPLTQIADRIGNAKVANMVALGACIGLMGLFDRGSIEPVIRAMTKRDELVGLNLEAIDAGASFVGALRRDADLWAV
jgi:Pyruvate/2-oxoacid:ferredoxin oxidoreductase gamma subunit